MACSLLHRFPAAQYRIQNISGPIVRRKLLCFIPFALTIYIGYAGIAVRELALGVAEGDVQAISNHVDFLSVRASIKEQLASMFAATALQKQNDDSKNVGTAAIFGLMFIDDLLTPSGIRVLLSDGATGAKIKSEFNFDRFTGHFAILTPTRFQLSDKDGTSIVFSLADWTWKITDVQISPKTLGGEGERIPMKSASWLRPRTHVSRSTSNMLALTFSARRIGNEDFDSAA